MFIYLSSVVNKPQTPTHLCSKLRIKVLGMNCKCASIQVLNEHAKYKNTPSTKKQLCLYCIEINTGA